MFPLAGNEFPTNSAELAASIRGALADVFTLPGAAAAVSVTGDFPAIGSLTLNLDGATVRSTHLPPKPVGAGQRKPGITVEGLKITGHPIRHQQAKLEVDVTASGLRFDFDRDSQGHPLLVLADAQDGKVQASISTADLQALLLEGAKLAAGQQGVTIQDLQLELSPKGPRSIAADVRVKAKKMFMSGTILLRGQLDIDDQLNATASNLNCTGEGMVGSAAAGFLQKKLDSYEGTSIPLMAFSLGDVTLRDLQIKVNGAIQVTAAFGHG